MRRALLAAAALWVGWRLPRFVSDVRAMGRFESRQYKRDVAAHPDWPRPR